MRTTQQELKKPQILYAKNATHQRADRKIGIGWEKL